jgi:hypothetical protein
MIVELGQRVGFQTFQVYPHAFELLHAIYRPETALPADLFTEVDLRTQGFYGPPLPPVIEKLPLPVRAYNEFARLAGMRTVAPRIIEESRPVPCRGETLERVENLFNYVRPGSVVRMVK